MKPSLLFTSYPDIFTTVSTRQDGAMRAKAQKQNHHLQTREIFLKSHGISPRQIVSAELVHGNTIYTVSKEDLGKVIPCTDGLITNEKNLYLSITIADCLPIFFYDPVTQAIGLVHAGWRGLEKEIIAKCVTAFQDAYNCKPNNMLAVIGPGIGVCHFEVQEDLLHVFKDYPQAIEKRNDTYFIDLKAIAQQQLLASGLTEQYIDSNSPCTYCEKDIYFSHRRGHTCPEEVMLALIGMR